MAGSTIAATMMRDQCFVQPFEFNHDIINGKPLIRPFVENVTGILHDIAVVMGVFHRLPNTQAQMIDRTAHIAVTVAPGYDFFGHAGRNFKNAARAEIKTFSFEKRHDDAVWVDPVAAGRVLHTDQRAINHLLRHGIARPVGIVIRIKVGKFLHSAKCTVPGQIRGGEK
jgi:hypothetical protein